SKSYGLKALEPLYMGQDLRTGDITEGGASVVAYANYCMARDNGQAAEAAEILASSEDYNHYDCRSTLRLRDSLLPRATERGVRIGQQRGEEPEELREAPALAQEQRIEEHVRTRLAAAHQAGTELAPEDQAL